jgi:GNAT superfamily N-acetyltransferase
MIRTATLHDTTALMALAKAIELFSASELGELAKMLADSLGQADDEHPFWITDDDDGLVGLAYCEPERMTSGTWNLQLIGVHPAHQRQGRGAKLLLFIEERLMQWGARILLVETMGIPEFEPVRMFYRSNGFEEEACIREFYAAGADKVVFRKVLFI